MRKFHFMKYRNSRPEVFCKKDALNDFAKVTRKNLYQSFFLNIGAGFQPETLLQKKIRYGYFSVNFQLLCGTSANCYF